LSDDFWTQAHNGAQPNANNVSLTYAKNCPCAICGQKPWTTDTYPIVIEGAVYCGRCWTNARQLFPNNN